MTTIKDIAKIAGVSSATVSRIINGKGEASQETINRIMKLVSDLNYKPNRLAKTLSQRSSNIIAVMLPNLVNPYFGELLRAIDTEATNHNFQLLICNTNDCRKKVEQFLDSIINNYAFGAIICTLQVTLEDLKQLEKAGVHTVTIDRSSFEHPYSAVNIDQEKGSYIATEFLIKKGARNIIFISGPEYDSLSPERETGYKRALKKYGLSAEPVILRGTFSLESGYQLTHNYIKEKKPFDAIFASNDLMAIGAMRACRDFKLSVPDKVKIIGNDNLTIDEYLLPKLTSLSQNKKLVGKTVIEELLSLKDEKVLPRKILIQPRIIVRETT